MILQIAAIMFPLSRINRNNVLTFDIFVPPFCTPLKYKIFLQLSRKMNELHKSRTKCTYSQ
mgnify:CR=1 FL=1